jgi:general secretion pathway protein H
VSPRCPQSIESKISTGFTLIEILVVLAIIGITLGMTILAFGDFGASRRIVVEAEQLQNMIKLAQQQAILEAGTLGMDITKTSYQVYRFIPPSTWTPISKRNIFKSHTFPKDTLVRLNIPFKAPNNVPDIVINATGDLTPFTLELGTQKTPTLVTITGQQNGNLELRQANP